MGPVQRIDDHRGVRVRRYNKNGESVRSTTASLGGSRRWAYKLLARATVLGDLNRATDCSPHPHVLPTALGPEIVEAIRLIRLLPPPVND